jgi:hypothetical protein
MRQRFKWTRVSGHGHREYVEAGPRTLFWEMMLLLVLLCQACLSIPAEPQHTPAHGTARTVVVQVDSWRNLWKSLEICHSSL